MKLQELSLEELKETNGGFLFGSSNSTSGLGLGLGIGNLLSFSSESHDDEMNKSHFSLLNDFNLSLEGLFDS